MRRVNTVLRYESSTRPWRRLLAIAADYFPDRLADLTFLQSRGVKLELHVNGDRASYSVQLVGPDLHGVEADRETAGLLTPLSQPLAALADDSQEHERAEGRRLARDVASADHTVRAVAV